MKRQILDSTKLVGKSIKSIGTDFHNGLFFLLFEDDTFAQIAATPIDKEFAYVVMDDVLDLEEANNRLLVELGIVTQDQIETYWQKKEHDAVQEKALMQRMEYERLKAIFDPAKSEDSAGDK